MTEKGCSPSDVTTLQVKKDTANRLRLIRVYGKFTSMDGIISKYLPIMEKTEGVPSEAVELVMGSSEEDSEESFNTVTITTPEEGGYVPLEPEQPPPPPAPRQSDNLFDLVFGEVVEPIDYDNAFLEAERVNKQNKQFWASPRCPIHNAPMENGLCFISGCKYGKGNVPK